MSKRTIPGYTQRILILGHIGEKNFGDEWMLKGLLSGLDQKFTLTNITILTHDTNFTRQDNCIKNNSLNIKSLSVWNTVSSIITSDVLIISGGTHLHDHGTRTRSYWSLIKCLRWMPILALTKICRTKSFFLGHGLGPLSHSLYRGIVKVILKSANGITLRDEHSLQLAEEINLGKKCKLAADLSFLCAPQSITSQRNKDGDIVLGISFLPYFTKFQRSPQKDTQMIKNLANILRNVHSLNPIKEVRLFSFFEAEDDLIMGMLRERLGKDMNVRQVIFIDTDSVTKQCGECTHFLGMRLHSCILSFVCNVKLLMVAYHSKCYAFAEEIDLDNKYLSPVETVLDQEFDKKLRSFLLEKHTHRYNLERIKRLSKRAKRNFGVF